MFRKKNRSKKHSRAMLSAYSIIMILIILLGIMSHVLPKARYTAAVLEDEAPSVEVGPGEWEGEMPTGGPAELNGVKPEDAPEPMELPEGESFKPAVGDEVTGENLPASRMATDEVAPDDEMSNRTVEGVEGDDLTTGEEAALISAVEPEEFDSLEACEEVYGEDGCAIVEGSGVEGAELYQILMLQSP